MSEYILTEREKHLIETTKLNVDAIVNAFPKVLHRLDKLEAQTAKKIPYDHPFNAKTTYDIGEHFKSLEQENKELNVKYLEASTKYLDVASKYSDLMDKYGELLKKQS
jgi:hypothetical protein